MNAHVIGRRKSFGRVLAYLAGPGRNGEHVDPRIVTGDREASAFVDRALDREGARLAAEHLDSARVAWQSRVKELALHVSLSFNGAERVAPEVRRAAYEAYVERMGCFDRSAWVAVEHGPSAVRKEHGVLKGGNDHGHLVISMVGDDGKAVRLGLNKNRSQEVARSIERDFGLQVLPSHEAGLAGMRAVPREQLEQARERDEPVTMQEEVTRRVRAAKAEARGPSEFPGRLREHGVVFAPRYAKGSTERITGYKVRLAHEERWFTGGQLGGDLTWPRLEAQWRNPGAAHEAAGAFASMSRAHERDPGPMWEVSREIARSAQTRQATGAAATGGLKLAALLAEPEKGPAEWLAIGALAVGAAQQLHAAHVANGHTAFAGELERVKGHWTSAKADLTAAAAVEPARAPWLGQSRSTERGIEIE